MKIKDLKQKHPLIYERIKECQEQQGNTFNDELDIMNGKGKGNFDWDETSEDRDIWNDVNNRNFDSWYEFHDLLELLKGRYIKVIDETGKRHYPCYNGDYLKFEKFNVEYEYWRSEENDSYYWGLNVHRKYKEFELMPKGFSPTKQGWIFLKYNLRDEIIIREDLHTGIQGVVKSMLKNAGKKFTISECNSTFYNLSGDIYNWTDEMIDHEATKKLHIQEIPEYVECIESENNSFTVGKIYNWPHPIDNKKSKRNISSHNLLGKVWKFKPSTKEAYEAQLKKDDEDELLKEAKKRYPIGTRFYPAHINNNSDYCIVTNNNFEKFDDNTIIALTDEGKNWNTYSKYGNTSLNRNVYYNRKWARIVEREFEIDKWYEFKSGKEEINYQIAKCSEVDNDYLKSNSWIINSRNFYKYGGAWNLKSIYNVRELKKEDEKIQKHLPLDHPDKINTLDVGELKSSCVSYIDECLEGVSKISMDFVDDETKIDLVSGMDYDVFTEKVKKGFTSTSNHYHDIYFGGIDSYKEKEKEKIGGGQLPLNVVKKRNL